MIDPLIQVLLLEQEPDTISVISLFLSEIKECRLEVCSSVEKTLEVIPQIKPNLILFAHNLAGKNHPQSLGEIHRRHPAIYLIVSLLESDLDLTNTFMIAGANDCVIKDKNYIPNLVSAVKRAFIRIAERNSFPMPRMARAEQFAMDENLPDLVFSLDTEGKILHVNRAIQGLLGYEPGDVLGRPFVDLVVGEESKKVFLQYFQRVDSVLNFRGEVSLLDRIGIQENFEINCTLMEGEMIYGVARKEQLFQFLPQTTEELEAGADLTQDVMPGRVGPYRVLTLLGAGAMGRVYKGYDDQLDRVVAIKVLSKSLASDQQQFERFHGEAKILASIVHPNIALIYYFGDLGGIPYFCMEYLPGGSIENILRQRGTFDAETAVSYTMQVALGLKEALQKGVIHLDVKPSNLMIAENERVKLVDFGLARTSHDTEEAASSLIGTPLYIAPEQIQGGVIDHRCDIYSLGITFFQMLYGFAPFSGNTVQEIFTGILRADFPPRDALDSSIPHELYEIIRRMTARDLQNRYKQYSELIDDLEVVRRSSSARATYVEVLPPATATVRMQGLLYDHPFPEILGEVFQRGLSGKLTLSWKDLYKNIHFKNGKVIAVLSSQEGESLIDLLLEHKQLSPEKFRRIRRESSDLFLTYSSVISRISPDLREKLEAEFRELGWRILRGLFSWQVGEFILEEGEFPAQLNLEIPVAEVLLRGIKEWMDSGTIRRRLMEGRVVVMLENDFNERLRNVNIVSSDRFLLYRFQNSISFPDLFALSAISEPEFYRLVYLFYCLGVLSAREMQAVQKKKERAPSQEMQVPKKKEPAPLKVEEESPVPAVPQGREKLEPVRISVPRSRLDLERVNSAPPPQIPSDLANYYLQCALGSYENKNYWAAVEYCKKGLEIRRDPRILELMGNALSTHPSFKHEAMEAFKEALQLDPSNPYLHRDIADLYFSTGNYALAKAKYQAVLKMNPSDKYSALQLKEISKMKK